MTFIDRLRAFWRSLDPKLKASIGGLLISYVTTRYGIALDATTSAIAAAAAAAFLGYKVENAGSELRAEPRTFTAADSGGLRFPHELAADPGAPVGPPDEHGDEDAIHEHELAP